MPQELISIVMPVKNGAVYLAECLDSILEQSYTHWELLVVNDHSTDHTNELLLSYAQKDQRIKVLQNEGQGIIHALRLAYTNSEGTYISRMDADDVMTPNKLSVLYKNLKEWGRGHLAIGKVRYFSATQLGEGYQAYEEWLNRLTEEGQNFQELYKECVIPSPCWMLHRTDLDQSGAFDSDLYPEDYDLCFRFYQSGLKCIPCNETLHHWRDYSERTSRNSPDYADNGFIQIKCHYFLKLNHDTDRPLVLWGAGKKGKAVARYMNEQGQSIHWVCNNPNKIGHNIYGIEMQASEKAWQLNEPQIIVAVAIKDVQQMLKDTFAQRGLEGMKDVFFFC